MNNNNARIRKKKSEMNDLPFVSCIMPTSNRRRFVPQAITYFLRQDYLNRELIIADDGTDPVRDLVPENPHIRYTRLDHPISIGAKRNLACREAKGDIIIHWDDDDWMADWRVTYQVRSLINGCADICGLDKVIFYDPYSKQSWRYVFPKGSKPWVVGGTFCYTKAFWSRNPFPKMKVGEDTRFLWTSRPKKVLSLKDEGFYVAIIHPGNTSPKRTRDSRWHFFDIKDIHDLLGKDLNFYQTLLKQDEKDSNAKGINMAAPHTNVLSGSNKYKAGCNGPPPDYGIIMVAHNGCEIVKMSTQKILRHSADYKARLVVVDNASNDGTEEWLKILAQRGDIDLIESKRNLGHGPGIELARREIRSPYIVTIDSDAFPLSDDWLRRLHARLKDKVKVAGILHHRDYIHPSCLMIARKTLEDLNLTFLDEKDCASRLDVAERISCEIRKRGFRIAGLERTGAKRRGSASEPVYLGSEYEQIVYHQWYTTRAAMAPGRPVDDVPREAIELSLDEVFEEYHAEPRDIIVVIGIRAISDEQQRLRNAKACLRALNLQDLPRWRYRVVIVEQDRTQNLKSILGPLADRYIFAYNPGPYNRGWAFNIGASLNANKSGILCLIDADLLVQPDFLSCGLKAFQSGMRAFLPYNAIAYLDRVATERALRDRLERPMRRLDPGRYHGRLFTTSQGGCIWVDASLYHEIGGHDERFRGWGFEDREFWVRLSRAAKIGCLKGRLLHLDHPPPSMHDQWVMRNEKLHYELTSSSSKKPLASIGNVGLYASEGRLASRENEHSIPGLREWENWHRWPVKRIENIVWDEKRRSPRSSIRSKMARIIIEFGNTFLDVGCGPGALWPHLKLLQPRISCVGVDVTYKMLEVAHMLFPKIPLCHSDAGNLPFSDSCFDVVLVRHLLEHLPDWLMEKVMKEAIRVARRAVVLGFYKRPRTQGCRYTTRLNENFLETCWTATELETRISKAGWRVSERFTITGSLNEKDEIWILKGNQKNVESDCSDKGTNNKEQPKINIIMPTYRRSHTIFHAVESIINQTYDNWELIIIDNAGDGNYYFDEPRIRVYCHTGRISASYARNMGLQYATGDIVCFFDDDDEMLPTYLERIKWTFQANPKAKMVRCGMIVREGRENYSYATPECSLRRSLATPTWRATDGIVQDQRYFSRIINANGLSEKNGGIAVIKEGLCKANTDPYGGLRSGRY
jgi:glycosyltransferase involved in cell wall biosynthesis